MQVGTRVELIDCYNSLDYRMCFGTVERLTKTQVVVRTDFGHIERFRRTSITWNGDDVHRCLGYAYPYCTIAIRKYTQLIPGAK